MFTGILVFWCFEFFRNRLCSHLKLAYLRNIVFICNMSFKNKYWASLVAQWLRIRLPVQGTWVRALVREDPTCRRATKPVRHDYWAYALEPMCHNYWARVPQLLKPARLEPVLRNKRSHSTATKSSPPLNAIGESPRAATKTQRSHK